MKNKFLLTLCVLSFIPFQVRSEYYYADVTTDLTGHLGYTAKEILLLGGLTVPPGKGTVEDNKVTITTESGGNYYVVARFIGPDNKMYRCDSLTKVKQENQFVDLKEKGPKNAAKILIRVADFVPETKTHLQHARCIFTFK